MLGMGELDPSNNPDRLFEQYKLIAEDLSRIREQRDRAIRTYITINSIILAAFGLLLRGPRPDIGWMLALIIVVPLFLVGAIASLQWAWRLQEFEVLVNQRLVVLELIERNPKMATSIHEAFTHLGQAQEVYKTSHNPHDSEPHGTTWVWGVVRGYV